MQSLQVQECKTRYNGVQDVRVYMRSMAVTLKYNSVIMLQPAINCRNERNLNTKDQDFFKPTGAICSGKGTEVKPEEATEFEDKRCEGGHTY